MNIIQRKPATVGEILQEEFLEPLHLKIGDLAEILNVHRNTASAIINNNSRISVEMAMRLAKAFGTSPTFWINLQTATDMWELSHSLRFQKSLEKVKVANHGLNLPIFA